MYAEIRDNVVAPALAAYGRTATLRHETTTYTPSTGAATSTTTDTTVTALLTSKGGKRLSNDGSIVTWDRSALIAPTSTLTVAIGDFLTIGSTTYRILDVSTVDPDSTIVLYKVGMVRA